MVATRSSRSAEIRARLQHPVIDADGHMLEFTPAMPEYLAKAGGAGLAKRFAERSRAGGNPGTRSLARRPAWSSQTWDERRATRTPRSAWWTAPTKNTLDAATATVPRLLYERLDELGMDFVIAYGNMSLSLTLEPDEELRRGACRAVNMLQADLFRDVSARITPVAAIPMYTPAEAIDELEHAVGKLGLKVIVIPPGVPRPIPALHKEHPEAFPDACWVDHFSLDSACDYDPFWRRCGELRVAVTSHGGLFSNFPTFGRSISNFVANHLGNHACLQSHLCKSLFMGGVTRRFPGLNIAFLECGAGWACVMYSEILGAWGKRNLQALEQTNPANLDQQAYLDLLARYGGPAMANRMDAIQRSFEVQRLGVDMTALDEFAALHPRDERDLAQLFSRTLFFGCEADDPINAWAFDTRINPFGERLKAVFGSDIGHYDVPDMAKVVEEAYELVERHVLSDQDFRDFAADNAIRLHGRMNPDFFRGTAVEAYAKQVLARDKARA